MFGITLYFSLGYLPSVEYLVNREKNQYNDIVQGSFIDAYRNNTFKTCMMYKWVADYCKRSTYVLFVDDDYFVNTHFLLKYVRYLETSAANDHWKMFGFMGRGWKAQRNNTDFKNFISEQEYPDVYFPYYLIGGSILTSLVVVNSINRALPFVRKISIDDVYIGMIAKLCNIKLVNQIKFNPDRKPYHQLQEYLSIQGYNTDILLKAWAAFEQTSKVWIK